MSGPDFGKPFAELTADEIAQLEAYDWNAGQIMRAMSMALRDGEMEAFADLLARLAKKDPRKAQAILAAIEADR
jgi:hypothetical protein